MFVVVCRDDRDAVDTPGPYVAATRTVFNSREDAERFMAGVNTSREPRIVSPTEYLTEIIGWRVK